MVKHNKYDVLTEMIAKRWMLWTFGACACGL